MPALALDRRRDGHVLCYRRIEEGRMVEDRTEAAVAIKNAADRVRGNIGRVIVGRDDVIELALVALFAGGHILLEDVPGIGKTTFAKAIARSVGCSFRRIQFTPDLMPSDVTGIHYYNQKSGEFEFRAGPIMANIVLADEINRATPRTQSALLEAMEERQVTIDGVTMPLPLPFMVLATQNPIELEGTFPLPEAQLDRFVMRVRIGYPTESEEDDILLRFERENPLETLAPAVEASDLLRLRALVPAVHCEASVRRYLLGIIRATREHPALELGASPRASMALFRTARVLAAIRGRDYVLPDDVKSLVPVLLPHRLILSSQSRLRGRDTTGVLEDVLAQVPVPVGG